MDMFLQRFSEIEGVEGAILVGKDGLVVAGTITSDDAEILGAMAAACFSSISHFTEQIGTGEARKAIVESERGVLTMVEVGDLILVVNTVPGVHLGRVIFEMTRASQLVAERVGA